MIYLSLLVCMSRVKNPKHIYINSEEWFSHLDIQLQRLNPDVIEAQIFERMLKIQAAKQFRKFYQDSDTENSWSAAENVIADKIHDIWLCRQISKEDTIISVAEISDCNQSDVERVYDKLAQTDEFLLQVELPFLRVAKINELLNYKNQA